MRRLAVAISCACVAFLSSAHAQGIQQTKGDFQDKFRQLDEVLPSPNVYRNAAGEPGHQYWQQEADYSIRAELDEENRKLIGKETISYTNNSPDTLRYLWLQLEQNIFKRDSMKELATDFGGVGRRGPAVSAGGNGEPAKLSLGEIARQQDMADNDYGYDITRVADTRGNALPYTIVGTLMRIDLPTPLASGKSTTFSIDWEHLIVEENIVSARSGFEHFPDDEREGGNDIFLLAQWFPRMIAYSDYEGWHNKEFLGRGEFTLEFGDYDVQLTVPNDHIVSATGELQNASAVLSATQRSRLNQARNKTDAPMYIVTPEEALENEKSNPTGKKTWRFVADNVRDFAWASSRKFMWDAQAHKQPGAENDTVLAMSFWPKEGGELWEKYSTAAIVHTLKVYSRFSFDYPYPTAQSVNGPVGGMEYPMITFNGPRTTLQDDGSRTYTMSEKVFLVGVVIHEIGHIYFPMTVNSDERQWTWMDEGINSFLDLIACYEWDPDMPWTGAGLPRDVTAYMASSNQVPIMTQSDSVLNLGSNAYRKPSAALHILRDTILGRENFDFAFKEYARRWKFKRPTPSDFFRTIEEASGTDLDWFWRGWFYTTDHVDISIDGVYKLQLDTKDPDIDYPRQRQENADKPNKVGVELDKAEGIESWVDSNPKIRDFYDENDIYTVTNKERNEYKSFLDSLKPWEREAFDRAVEEDQNYYVLEFSNIGGLVMPIILDLEFTDGSTEREYIPAEIWRRSPAKVRKLLTYPKGKQLTQVIVDPNWETADVDVDNNYFPRQIIPSRIEAYKSKRSSSLNGRDIMHDMTTKLKVDDVEKEEAAVEAAE
ncbi:M1 family metallopeptidase [Hirschia baltica]|uniref:Putative Zn-dependent aminopeptidase n=1 Tax=Hirschia baltica (strain ATCC 49814 / DSM 5838 / IFAM 1418) TaxID=582402 RepID=C6XK80_HIRBI|nr:M1 family metallopeptidase [Hirschia baltica]ACT59525.1 putative Zn-dependent aminopeptidase [Hirschia baltica ATCC 49814]